MTKTEYSNIPEVQKWYDDQEKVLNEVMKKLSKYSIDAGSDYDDFYIYIDLNKEIIDSFKDNEIIEKAMNS